MNLVGEISNNKTDVSVRYAYGEKSCEKVAQIETKGAFVR